MRSNRFIRRLAGLIVLFLPLVTIAAEKAPDGDDGASESRTIHVSQDGEGQFAGETGKPIRAALQRLPEAGGTIVIEPGEYLVRRKIALSDGVTIRGADAASTVLRFPAPTLTTGGASQGDRSFPVAETGLFLPDTVVQILPPEGTDRFEALEEKTKSATIEAATIDSIEDDRLILTEPLPVDLPEGSRVGYAHNVLSMRKPIEGVTIENLTLEGGRRPEIPMPGHAKRCAVWASSPYTYAKGPQAPPIRKLRVRHCIIRDFYGRAVAMYNVADSEVIGCRIARIPDDAINFDHFNYRNRAEGNTVRDARIGVTLNDASGCTVRHNRLVRCDTGVRIWWWHKVDPEGVNERNTIEHNAILAPRGSAVSLSQNAVRNTIRYNFVEGPIRVEESDNTVERNTRLSPAASDGDS